MPQLPQTSQSMYRPLSRPLPRPMPVMECCHCGMVHAVGKCLIRL